MAKQADPRVIFHYQVSPFHFPHRTELKKSIIKLFRVEKHDLDRITYIFCTDGFLLDLNRRFLSHDTLTDIITFPMSVHPVVGEVYISIERVKENASIFNTSFLSELHRVIFHGALHLCGYKDKTPAQIKQMRSRENFYLKSLH